MFHTQRWNGVCISHSQQFPSNRRERESNSENWLRIVVQSAIAAVLLVRVCIYETNMCELNRIDDDDDDGITPSLHNHTEFSWNERISLFYAEEFVFMLAICWLFHLKIDDPQFLSESILFSQFEWIFFFELSSLSFTQILRNTSLPFERCVCVFFSMREREHLYTQLADTLIMTIPWHRNGFTAHFSLAIIPLISKIICHFFHYIKPTRSRFNEAKRVTTTVWMATPKSVQILRLHELNTHCYWKKYFLNIFVQSFWSSCWIFLSIGITHFSKKNSFFRSDYTQTALFFLYSVS